MDDAKRRAEETYNAAAEFFDDPALGFWDRFGRATVDRLELKPGAIVLDACAGAGASALPAAERVGPTGKVVAVDLADNLLELTRAKADRLGLRHLETLCAPCSPALEPNTSEWNQWPTATNCDRPRTSGQS